LQQVFNNFANLFRNSITTLIALTNNNGEYIIEKITVGTYTMVASMKGYNYYSIDNIQINDDIACEPDFPLTVAKGAG